MGGASSHVNFCSRAQCKPTLQMATKTHFLRMYEELQSSPEMQRQKSRYPRIHADEPLACPSWQYCTCHFLESKVIVCDVLDDATVSAMPYTSRQRKRRSLLPVSTTTTAFR